MFLGLKLLKDVEPLKNWNVSKGESLLFMFQHCKSLKNPNVLKKWKFKNKNGFDSMF